MGNPLRGDVEGDLAVLVEDPLMNKGIGRLFKERYPEIVEINSLHKQHDGIAYITSVTKVPDGKTFRTRERYIFKATLKEIADEKRNSRGMVEAAEKLRNLAQACGRKKIRVPIPENQSPELTRKVLEYVFVNTDINIIMHIPKKQDAEAEVKVKPGSSSKGSGVPRDNGVLIMKPGERTYAQLLKEVKEQVDMKQLGVEVKNVRKTRGGELMLTIRGGAEKTEPVRQAIESKLKDVQVKNLKQPETMFQIYGIEATTTQMEVKEAIARTIGEDNDNVTVKAIRTTTYDEQVATVAVSRPVDKKLKTVKSVKIGWNLCRVREWIQLPRCHKCQSHGHLADSCKGPVRSSCCWNCGEEGHKATSCSNEKYCIVCATKGHKSGTRQCPVFEKLLVEAKAKNPSKS